MEILELTQANQEAKIRTKKAIWALLDEIKESIKQAKVNQNDQSESA